MSVIPMTQVALVRKRRELTQSLQTQDWQHLLRLERELLPLIDGAMADLHRSPIELLKELGRVIALYRQLAQLCQSYTTAHHSP
ncbi:MAG: hypothetical protein KTR20_09210 [Cellvibrionaceae bacterium]|nr:hypothetical protein [Cellvibrionaceae bacterium]